MYLIVPFTDMEVNEFGSVRYTDWMGNRRCDQGFANKSGYKMIKTFGGKFYYVHRLVARVFVYNPCPEYFKVVHHLDNQRSNNVSTNLQWTTQSLNNAWKVNQKLVKKTRGGYKIRFIFDKKTFNLQKIYENKNCAEEMAKNYKLQLINAARNHFIECSRSSLNPNEIISQTVSGFVDA